MYYGDGSEWKEISGGGLPGGTENQVLRYNSSNELEPTSIIEIVDTEGTVGQIQTAVVRHHRQANALRAREKVAHRIGQTCGF